MVEDNPVVGEAIVEYVLCVVARGSVTVHRATGIEEAFAILETKPIGIVMTDVNLGEGRDGLEIARVLPQSNRPYIIAMSAVPELHGVQASLAAGVVDAFLQKPFFIDDLRAALRRTGRLPLRGD